MPIFVPDEIVTAAKINLIMKPQGDGHDSSRTFTNTSYLDLDALTGGSGSLAAVSVSVVTETTALVIVSAATVSNTGGITILAFRVSGATTLAASAAGAGSLRAAASTVLGASRVHFLTGLTAGTNVFELQAAVSAGTGTLTGPYLTVIPI